MAQALAGAGVNLGDERACIRTLLAADFTFSDIVLYGDQAVLTARQAVSA
jgi:hypothetical protein